MDKTPEEQLFKWVKAEAGSLPNKSGHYSVRKEDSERVYWIWFNRPEMVFEIEGQEPLEWLCPAPSPSAEVEALSRELEASKAVIERLAGLYRTDFLDTCEENGHLSDTCQELWKQYCIANQIPTTPKK